MSNKNAVKEGLFFIDYLHLSIRWLPEHLSPLSLENKFRFKELLNQFVLRPTVEHLMQHPTCKPIKYKGIEYFLNDKICDNCKKSVFNPLNWYLRPEGSIYVGRSKNHTISVHFKGSWFTRTNVWDDDLIDLEKSIFNLKNFIKQHMLKNGLPYRFEVKVSRIDIAKNFYGAEIYNPDLQTFHNKAIKEKNLWKWNDRVTSINIGRKDNPHIYFRSYDKRFEKEKSKAVAISRFNTDQFCRNEWSVLSHKLRALKLKNWSSWNKMIKEHTIFNQLVLHLRKNRDVTYFSNENHEYNLIHLEKGFKTFKKPTEWEEYEMKKWTPGPMTLGTLDNHTDEYTFQDLHKILEVIAKKTDMIPPDIFQKLKEDWMDKGLCPKNYQYYLKKGWIAPPVNE